MDLRTAYHNIRQHSLDICHSLKEEDYVVQPIIDVSPPKWHLGHSTWFFETFLLQPYLDQYVVFDPDYNFVFNSYYETIGARVVRTNRGNLSRPSVAEVRQYRIYVDEAMDLLLKGSLSPETTTLLELGLNHEQQHQELLTTDIKYILGHNPLLPAYQQHTDFRRVKPPIHNHWLPVKEGVYEIGAEGNTFCFDNECSRHKVYVNNYAIQSGLVTNGAFIDFINEGGYRDFRHWHSEGWDWVKANQIVAPLYWQFIEGAWYHYNFNGLELIDLQQPLCHISYYEAAAYASWRGLRLPTEAEWEIAQEQFHWGERWEWTESAYLPYPGFYKPPGAIGEYNGKFMINQMVLRGASEATPRGHSRATYRNFFHPHLRWQFTGIRLAKSLNTGQ